MNFFYKETLLVPVTLNIHLFISVRQLKCRQGRYTVFMRTHVHSRHSKLKLNKLIDVDTTRLFSCIIRHVLIYTFKISNYQAPPLPRPHSRW